MSSAIPPHIAGAAAQAGFVAPEASRVKDGDSVNQAQATARQEKAAAAAAEAVDTEDGDTAIFADGHGGGSQGRAFSEGSEEEKSATESDGASGQEDDGGHLDLQA